MRRRGDLPGRKSPKKGNAYQAFIELYKIRPFLKDPNLRLRLDLIDMEEYRLLNGWSRDKKKGSDRFDRIPLTFVEEVRVDRREDYMQFIPMRFRRSLLQRILRHARRFRCGWHRRCS